MNSGVPRGKVLVNSIGEIDKTDAKNKFYWNTRDFAFHPVAR